VTATVARPLRLETPRLLLHPLVPADLAAFHAINTDPAVARYLFDGRQVTMADSARMLDDSRTLLARHGHGLFAVRRRDNDAVIGWSGYLRAGEPPDVEIVYALAPAAWGRGIAVEATRAAIIWGARYLGMTEFHASVDAPNLASLRVLEKLGFREARRGAGCAGELVHCTLDAALVHPSGIVCVAA
jgi:ribosomal-protein-alanine N-acetyltransferase